MALINYWPGFWTDLRLAVTTQWPEVGINQRALQVQKVNWVNLAESGAMPFPYVVIHVSEAREVEWGMQNQAYEVDVTFYYLAKDAQGIAPALEGKMKTMQNYLLTVPEPFSTLQVLSMRAIDVTEVNEINAAFLEQHMAFTAGAVSFTAVVGEVLV